MPVKTSIATTALLMCVACANLVAQIPDTSENHSRTEALPAIKNPQPARDDLSQDNFYNANQVQNIHLTITRSDQQKMQAALPECIYVPATLSWNNQTLRQVGVRFKGNSSANPNQTHKRSYLIKFSKYKEKQRFLGMERISLDNGVQFGSLFSEPIITNILRQLGHHTHRCNYATLHVNDRFAGVYVNTERIDESFLERHFPGNAGGLWKNDTGGPGGDLRHISDDPTDYRKAFEPKNNEAKTDQELGHLLKLIKEINRVPDESFKQVLSQNFDVDDLLQTTAVMLLSGAFDQLTGWGPHNYYLYRNSTSETWHYLPWDLDVGFCEIAFGKVYVLEDWHAAWPVPLGTNNPLLERIIRNPNLLAKYRSIALDILESHFNPQQLCNTIDANFALIRNDLKHDPFPKRRVTVPTDQSYEDIVESMKQFIRKRYDTAKRQLADPGERPKPKQNPGKQAPPNALMERLQKSARKAEAIQRNLHEIQKTMQQIQQSLQQNKYEETEKLLDVMERLTEHSP